MTGAGQAGDRAGRRFSPARRAPAAAAFTWVCRNCGGVEWDEPYCDFCGRKLKLCEYVNEGPDAPPNPVGASGPDNKGG